MSNRSARRGVSRPSGSSMGGARISRNAAFKWVAAVLFGLLAPTQLACFRHKQAAPAAPKAPPASIRIAFLPLNAPNMSADLRWLSLAVPIMMAKVSENAPDLEAVPLWEAMPIAAEAAGGTRSITPEIAAYVASRLTAKWASEGELSSSKGGVRILVDFVPVKATLVPFRYEKEAAIDDLGSHFENAFGQFLRYLALRPMTPSDNRSKGETSIKEIAEALDREYGWFVTAEPGKSDKVVTELAQSDVRLARLLFNPSLYPSVGAATPAPKASDSAPPTTSPESRTRSSASTNHAQPAASAPPAAATARYSESALSPGPASAQTATEKVIESARPEPQGAPRETASAPASSGAADFVPPPPRTFSQKRDSSALPKASEATTPPVEEQLSVKSSGSPLRAVQSAPGGVRKGTGEKAVPPMNKASPTVRGQKFQIQVGSVRSRDDADAIAAKLAKADLTPEVETVDLKDKGVWYRVRLQGYESYAAAEAAGKKLLQEKTITQYWIVSSKPHRER